MRVVRTRKVRALTEKYYGRVARLFVLKTADAAPGQSSAAVRSAAMMLRQAADEAIASGLSRRTRLRSSTSRLVGEGRPALPAAAQPPGRRLPPRRRPRGRDARARLRALPHRRLSCRPGQRTVTMPRWWPTGGLWRHGDFLKLWSAETISQFGSQVSTTSQSRSSRFSCSTRPRSRLPRSGRSSSCRSSSSRCRLASGSTAGRGARSSSSVTSGGLPSSLTIPHRVRRGRSDAGPALRRRFPRAASSRSSSTSPTVVPALARRPRRRSSRATRSSRSAALLPRSPGQDSAGSSWRS